MSTTEDTTYVKIVVGSTPLVSRVIHFPRLSDAHIQVRKDGALLVAGTDYTVGSTTITFTPAITNAIVEIMRRSGSGQVRVDFQPGPLSDLDLNEAYLHAKYIAEEAMDAVEDANARRAAADQTLTSQITALQSENATQGTNISNLLATTSTLTSGLANANTELLRRATNDALTALLDRVSRIEMLPGFPVGVSNPVPVYPEDYGAVAGTLGGDIAAATANRIALQAALNSGRPLMIPRNRQYRIAGLLTVPSNARIFGNGETSQIIQITAGQGVASGTGVTDILISGVHFVATGVNSSLFSDFGVGFTNSSRVSILGCHFSNHYGHGVSLTGVDRSMIAGNRFVLSTQPNNTTMPCSDIALMRSCRNNIVVNNEIDSGQVVGISVQTLADFEEANRNVIAGNTVRGSRGYGIMVYRIDTPGDVGQIWGTSIVNNTISNILGTFINTAAGNTRTHGCGIYVQGAEGTVVLGNTVFRSHNGASLFAPEVYGFTLAPGGIGLTNCSSGSVVGNTLVECRVNGIDIGNANNLGETDGQLVIANNVIRLSGESGIRVRSQDRLLLIGNMVNGSGHFGLRIEAATRRNNLQVLSNQVIGSGNTAILVSNYDRAMVMGNVIERTAVHGIALTGVNVGMVTNNQVFHYGVCGITTGTDSTFITVGGNQIDGNTDARIALGENVSALIGIRLDCRTTLGAPNVIRRSTALWGGTWAFLNGVVNLAASNLTAGSVQQTLASFTLPPGSFVESGDGYRITLMGTSANNAAAKTIRLFAGGAQIGGSISLPASQANAWTIDWIVYRVGAVNSQRHYVTFNSSVSGTGTAVTRQFQAARTDVESSNIILHMTAEGGASDDVSCNFRLIRAERYA